MEPSVAFTQLLDKYLTQTITAEEQKKFFELVQSKKYAPELEAVVAEALGDAAFDVAEDQALRDRLFERVLNQRENPVRHIPRYRRWGWAAAILILVGGSIYFYATTKNNEKPIVVQQQNILPGTNKALLTLSDGTIITLDSASSGVIAQQGNAEVLKLPNGEIRYDVKGITAGKVMMNTMTTPRGGQYQLVLPDGSKAWLNAASSITYPAVFAGNERTIKIAGEVYLEITKDKSRPFLVDVDGKATVQVLGTSFNINSYANEGNIKTTLVEGSVKVIDLAKASGSHRYRQEVTLRPGQQAVMGNSQENINIQSANIDQVLAWKNGFINFESGSFQEIMRQIERWYDVDVKFEGPMPVASIGGRMDRGVQIADLMAFLNNFGIRSSLEGRTLILSGK